MKRLCSILALVALMGGGTASQAQFIGLEAGGYGSYLKPADLDRGTGYGAVVRGQLIEFLGYDVRAGYFSFKNPSVNMVPIEGTVIFRVPLPFSALFVGGGAGYYTFSGERGFSLDNDWGYYPVAGAEVHLGPVLVFFEWKYLFLQPEISRGGGGFAQGDKLDFNGSGFTIGVTLRF